MELTRNGICRDLSESPYRLTVGSLTYYFSSKLYLEKFKRKREIHRARIREVLTRRYTVEVDLADLSDLVLYGQVETRGYHVTLTLKGGVETLCRPNQVRYSGGVVTKRN